MKYKFMRAAAILIASVTALSFSSAVFADEPTSFSVGKVVSPSDDKLVKVGGLNYEITQNPTNFPGKCTVSVNTLSTEANVVIPSQISIEGKVYNVTAIGENAFAENKYVKTIQIGANVESVAPTSFAGAMTLESFSVEAGSDKFTAVDGILYTKDKTTVVSCPMGKEISSYTIPNTVTSIAACAFYGNHSLYSVVLNNSKISEIGDFAFTDCDKLAVVNMGHTINKIGMAAFAQTDLKSIVLPVYLKEMGSGAFAGTKLVSVKIPDEITEIPYGAFSNCTLLSEVKWSEKLETIGDYAFANTAVKEAKITDLVRTIGYSAFADCSNLKTVTLGKRVNTIGEYAFSNCGLITDIKIPAAVSKIGENAFLGCQKLINVAVESANATYTAKDGVLYTKGYLELLLYPSAKMNSQFTIPVETISIRTDAFSDARYIAEFSVEDGNKAYMAEDGVLYSIDKYELVRFPMGKNFTGYQVPDFVYKIKDGAFYGSAISGDVNIGGNVTEIGENAFTNCQNIKSFNVTATNSNYTSQDGVLYTKDMMYLISYPALKNDVSFSVPSGVSVIKENAFLNTLASEVILPEGIAEIGQNAFAHSKLEVINLPASLNIIEDKAFSDTFIVTVSIPGSLTEIGRYVFSDNPFLSTVTFTGAAAIGTVGANVFSNDDALTKIYVPASYLNEYKILLVNMDVDNYADLLSPQL